MSMNTNSLRLPNLIIAGTHKAGTTSLFRYLADHPDVCSSSIKEIGFFGQYQNGVDKAALNHYHSYFTHCKENSLIRLEASPGYLMQADFAARLMREVIPDARLVFILREPVSRFISFFLSNKSRLDPRVKDISFDSLVDIVLNESSINAERGQKNKDVRVKELVKRLSEGCYAYFIEAYLAHHSEENLCVMFYDDLSTDTRKFVKAVCKFAQIDASFFNNYPFSVENKPRTYRSNRLHNMIAILVNNFEPIMNRFPRFAGKLRTLYRVVNENTKNNYQISEHQISEQSKKRLHEYYDPHNRELREVLVNIWPSLHLPEWLREK